MTFVSLKRLVGRHRQAFEVIKSSPHTLNGLVTTETGACTAESYVDFIDRFLTDSPLRRRFNRRTEQRAFQFDHMPLLLEQDGASIHKRATLIPVLGKHKVRTVEMFPYTSLWAQPLDANPFAALKKAWHSKLDELMVGLVAPTLQV